MMTTLRIKRRAAGGAAGAPAGLANAELAYNEQDNVLYYGIGTGGLGGTATQVIAIGGPGAFALLTGTTFTGNVHGLTAALDDSSTLFATTAWYNNQKSAALPAMNGIAAAGTSNRWSPSDHVHASDTSKAPLADPSFTGRVLMPAGSTGVAGGLILTSGSIKTTPVVGDVGGVEFDGTSVSVITSTGARKTFAYTDAISSSASTLTGGAAGSVLYQSAADTTAFVTPGTNAQVLRGGTVPSWVDISSLTVASAGSSTNTTNVLGGTTGSIPYQSAAGTTSFITPGTNAQVLVGGTAPSWVTVADLHVAQADTATNATQLGGVVASAFAPLANPTFTGVVTVPTASFGDNTTLAASTAFVQSAVNFAVQGLDPKASVRAATVSNLASLSGLQTVDTVSLVDGDRVLVKDQTLAKDNGIYVVHVGAWTRASDFDSWTEIPAAFTFVEEGSEVNKGIGFTCTSIAGGTLNTTDITWVKFTAANAYVAGAGVSIVGSTVAVVGTAGRISVGATVDIDATYAGQSSIITLGTVTSGVWSATAIAVNKGGLGLTSALTGLVKGNGTSYEAAVADTDYLTPSSTLDGGTF